ncbi:MAG: hypothetical protein KatS3mg028_1174 [Bacteroidia bacterium]|nr:MAG: hypothetical protein KatS3mg028_1174 [Bacteroidia bacterium]
MRASNILFGKDVVEDLKKLDEKTLLEVFEGVPQVQISKDKLSECKNVVDFLAEAGVFSSKGETRKAIQNNAVGINKIKITSPEAIPTDFELLQGKYILAQKGKTNYVLIQVI